MLVGVTGQWSCTRSTGGRYTDDKLAPKSAASHPHIYLDHHVTACLCPAVDKILPAVSRCK